MSRPLAAFQKSFLSAMCCTACVVLTACGGGGGAVSEPPSIIRQSAPGPAVSPGAGYFVDALNGSDSNAGSFASPWRSLGKLSSVRLQAGETIFLRCGSVWRESLTLDANHLVDGAAVTAYGSDCNAANKPRITGADLFSGSWTKSGNVWRKSISLGTPKIEQLFVNGVALRTAQWPNHGGVGHEYAITASGAQASTSAISLSAGDSAVLAGKDLAGAKVQIRTQPWFIEERTVASLSASSLTLQTASVYPIDAGDGFVLQDKLWMLDAPGEFHHDTTNGVLYVYPVDAAAQSELNAAQVEGSVRAVGLAVSGRRNLTLSRLRVDMSTADGVAVHSAVSSTLDGVDALNNLRAGVRVDLDIPPVAPARGVTIKNGSYIGNGETGIDAGNVRDGDVLNNTVMQTGMLHPGWSIAAIIGGPGASIDGNTIQKTAFRGVQFSSFGSSRVSNNLVTEFCLRLDDCAAIYTYNGQAPAGLVQASTVESNRIEGDALTVESAISTLHVGIYLDDLTRMATVRNNTVIRTPVGIYLHNTSDSHVEGNKIWMSTDTSLMVNMDHSTGADLLTGNTFTGNQLVPAASISGTYPALPQTASSRAIRFWHAQHGTASLTSGNNLFTANQMVAFNGDTSIIAEIGRTDGQTLLSAGEWKTLNPGEATPSSPVYYDNYRTLLGAELLQSGDFEAGLGSWNTWFSPLGSGGGLALATDPAVCATRCARYASGIAGDRFSSPLFNMAAGQQYVISFMARFVASGSIQHPDIANPYPPYTSYVDSQGLKTSNVAMHGLAGQILRYEAFFTAASSSTAILNLRINEARVPVDFDSVSLRPVTGYTISNFSDWGSIVAAPPAASVNVSCASLGWAAGCAVVDIDGVAVPMPTAVAAGQSRMLLLANSTWRR